MRGTLTTVAELAGLALLVFTVLVALGIPILYALTGPVGVVLIVGGVVEGRSR